MPWADYRAFIVTVAGTLCICVGIVAVENSTVATCTLMGNLNVWAPSMKRQATPEHPQNKKIHLWRRHWACNPVLKKCAVQNRLIAATNAVIRHTFFCQISEFSFFSFFCRLQSIISYCSSKGIAQLYYVFFDHRLMEHCFIITVLAKWFF